MSIAGKSKATAYWIGEAIGRKVVPIILGGGDAVPHAGMRVAGRKRA